METIKLKFNGSLTSLCGNPFGRAVFTEQVENALKEQSIVTVLIPDNIDTVSMSFVQGFLSSLAEKYGMNNVSEHLIVCSAHSRVNRKFNEAMSMRV